MSKIRILKKKSGLPLCFMSFMEPGFLRKLTREPVDACFSWKIGVKLEISVYIFFNIGVMT